MEVVVHSHMCRSVSCGSCLLREEPNHDTTVCLQFYFCHKSHEPLEITGKWGHSGDTESTNRVGSYNLQNNDNNSNFSHKLA